MTTIAYHLGILAADTLSTKGGIKVSLEVQKIYRIGKYRVAISGELSPALEMFQTLKKMLKKETYEFKNTEPMQENFTIMCVKDGENFVRIFISAAGFWEKDGIPFAMGSGANFALGAMHFGATAEEAVRIASTLDIYTGDRIQVLS